MRYSLWQKNSIWYAGTYIKSKRYSISLRTKNKAIAEKRAESWLSDVIPAPTPTLSERLKFYLNYNPDRAERTDILAMDYMKEFIAYLGSDCYVSQITRDIIFDYKKQLQIKNQYNTVKMKMGTLKAIFNLAYREDLIQHMPFKGIVVGKSKSKATYLSREEVANLITAAAENPLNQGYILFLLYTGCRSGV